MDAALTGRDGDGYCRKGIIPISDPGPTIEERLRIRAAHQISLSYHEMTQAFLGRIRPELERFFVPQADTRWALNPDLFSVIDGNPGDAS